MRIYFACPIISEVIWNWIRPTIEKIELLAQDRRVEVEIAFPYDTTALEDFEMLGEEAKLEIFSRCKSLLEDADIVIALLDGARDYDRGAWDVGYFYRQKPERTKIIGVRTDFRNADENAGDNIYAMVECACDEIARSREELLNLLFDFIDKY